MAAPNCKKLIAMSACADRIERDYLTSETDYGAEIAPKLAVLHPPQPRLVSNARDDIGRKEVIRCTLVGADFFRKGGLETLRAFDRLLRRGAPLQLTIVSSMRIGDYVTHATRRELEEAMSIVERHQPSIAHFHHLANDKVLELFRRSDIGLLPTWAETYGYSVLEAQACGCPVISTDVRALPEINSESCGWIIPIPKDRQGNAIIGGAAARADVSERIQDGIERIMTELANDRRAIAQKSALSLQRIERDHDPDVYAATLEGIYREALS